MVHCMDRKYRDYRTQRILSITSYLSIIISILVIAQTHPANGYEISIYDAYPSYFWIAIILPFIISTVSIQFFNNLDKQSVPSVYQYTTVIGAMFAFLILLSLPFFRGYFLYTSGDGLAHYGYVLDIIDSGMVGQNNLYPPLHIWLYSLLSFTGLDFGQISLFVPQIFLTLYVSSTYILSKSIGFTPLEALNTTLLAIVPILGMEITREFVLPSFSAFCLIPLTLYVIIKSRNRIKSRGFSLLTILLLILSPFIHLEVALFLLIFLVITYIGLHLIALFRNDENNNNFSRGEILLPIGILSTGYLLWIMSFEIFQKILQRGYQAIFTDISGSPATIVQDSIRASQLGITDAVILIIKSYGPILAFLSLAAVLSFTIIVNFLLKREHGSKHLILAVLYFSFGILMTILFFKDWILGLTFRYAKFSVLIATLLLGHFIAHKAALQKKLTWKVVPCLFMSVLIVLAILSMYPSPWMNHSNRQIDMERYSGSTFFILHRDPSIPVIEMQTRFWNFNQVVYGVAAAHLDPNYEDGLQIAPPPHFGYDRYHYVGELYECEQYLAFTQGARLWYPTIYPNQPLSWQFSPADFKRLKYDPTVNSIYISTGLELYVVVPEEISRS